MSIRTEVLMGTTVTIEVVDPDAAGSIAHAFGWFVAVEDACSRFVAGSELARLGASAGRPVRVSDILFEAVQFAVRVAEATDGAFDPALGGRMRQRGFDREHRTGEAPDLAWSPAENATFRDIEIDAGARTIRLRRPLLLDLGAVAKGMAVDAAARELADRGGFGNFAIDAGGDLYLAGHNADDEPWLVGIRDPRVDGGVVTTVRVSDVAICTSGDYERRGPDPRQHHIVDPRSGEAVDHLASVTVLAPTAMAADALATAAFVLGPADGVAMLTQQGVEGLLLTAAGERVMTDGWPRD